MMQFTISLYSQKYCQLPVIQKWHYQ